jgi:hypothetical protein
MRAGADALRIQAVSDNLALEYRQPGQYDTEQLIVPRALLASVEGRTSEPVTLEMQQAGGLLVSWNDGGIPRVVEQPSADAAGIDVRLPPLPDSFASNPSELRHALQAAATILDRDGSRYALDCLQLRGSEGKIVATDGRQILVQSGFQFPWTQELLIPGTKLFGCPELAEQEGLDVGLTDNWVAFKTAAWTIWLPVNSAGRFPKIDDLIANPTAASCRLLMAPSDAAFLQQALERVPSDDEMNEPMTLALGGQVVVRLKPASGTRTTELVLSNSTLQGEPVAIHSNRRFLAKALKLGFREVCFVGPRAPALCDDGRRQYLWALLDPDNVIAASADAIRVESAAQLPSSPIHRHTRRRLTMTVNSGASNGVSTNGRHRARPVKPALSGHAHSCIEQAIFVRTALRETLVHTNELIRSLKRDKRRSRLVASTLASLKQLQKVAG